eukprot:Nitzschia sp. Nitz4//scaffold165_size50357//20018//21691//NITZ4_007021-RA/size50357-processed-gene-0.49-mRNA-1//1//CDS//3329538132//777//frame0
MDVLLALDIGSSSIRCNAFSMQGNGSIVAIPECASSKAMRAVQPNTGKIRLTYNTESIFDIIDQCLDSVIVLLRKKNPGFRVVGLGFSTFVMNLIAVDRNGRVLGDKFTLSYACNLPGVADECRALRSQLVPDQLQVLYQQTGTPIHSAYALPQLRHLYASESMESLGQIHQWQTLASLCLSRWVGRSFLPISYSEATWTGLLDFRHCAYNEGTTQHLPPGCLATLPRLADFSEGIVQGIPEFSGGPGRQKNRFYNLWPELRFSRLFLGVADGACANVGSKCTGPSRIAVTIGTSAAARVCLRQDIGPVKDLIVPQGLFAYRIDRHHILLGGALSDGGSVIEWVSQLLNLRNENEFQGCLDQVQELIESDFKNENDLVIEDPRPVVTIPFLSGERSTGFRDGATGAIVGLTRNVTPARLFRSCMEGVTLRLRSITELLVGIVKKSDTDAWTPPLLVASGNALEANAIWRQMVSDCTGLELSLEMDSCEGTIRGVAKLMAVAIQECNQPKDESLPLEELCNEVTSAPRTVAFSYFTELWEAQGRAIGALAASTWEVEG